MTFGTPVYPTHEMYPAGFKDKVAALADAYEGLVEATGEACDDFAGTAEREAEQAARMRVQELRAELGLS